MSNYFWTVDGRLINKNIIEHMTNNSFNVSNNSLCIDDVCITKEEISELKKLVPGYNILERSAIFDSLTVGECKSFLKSVFSLILNSANNNEKKNHFNKYFANGLYDPKSADILSFQEFYLDENQIYIDFQDIYLGIDLFNVINLKFTNENILSVLETNNFKVDSRLVFNFSSENINNMSTNYYYISYKNYNISLFKLDTTSGSNWKIILFTQNLLSSMYIKQDDIFNKKFKTELETIEINNQKNELSLTEFRSYVSNLRGVSLLDGKFNLDVFKNNLFVNYYKGTIDLRSLTDDDIMSKIETPEVFSKVKFENVLDEKTYLGYYELHDHYISLSEDNENLEIMLIYGQKSADDIFKWKLIYLDKSNQKID